jgi:hypothetical protein
MSLAMGRVFVRIKVRSYQWLSLLLRGCCNHQSHPHVVVAMGQMGCRCMVVVIVIVVVPLLLFT